MVTMQISEVRGVSTVPQTSLLEQRGHSAWEDQQQAPVVLLVDPDANTETMLQRALTGHRVVNARSVREVDTLVSTLAPGSLAMVGVRPDGSAPEVIRTLLKAGWRRVLALTDRGTELTDVLAAVDAGAGGVIRLAHRGQRPYRLDTTYRLSRREVEVVGLVADGLSNKAIGQQLSLSALTVKNHLARVGRKLGTGDRAHIVAIACRGGMITDN